MLLRRRTTAPPTLPPSPTPLSQTHPPCGRTSQETPQTARRQTTATLQRGSRQGSGGATVQQGDVQRSGCGSHGMGLPPPKERASPAGGRTAVQWDGAPLSCSSTPRATSACRWSGWALPKRHAQRAMATRRRHASAARGRTTRRTTPSSPPRPCSPNGSRTAPPSGLCGCARAASSRAPRSTTRRAFRTRPPSARRPASSRTVCRPPPPERRPSTTRPSPSPTAPSSPWPPSTRSRLGRSRRSM
mmetsp:Transcript_64704/g.134909  ORF Transcript_64704/g.134909 Transcript_64704/m.134909 type:complete len:245 (+) Transcript_64704:785-1519(+)